MKPRIFEDFVPISDSEALVSTGRNLTRLNRIQRARYEVRDGRVTLLEVFHSLARGLRVRLGGWFGDRLVYSDTRGIKGYRRLGPTAHQPFVHEGAVYYTDGWPHVEIYRNGKVFLGHFGDMIQVANPCFTPDGVMYFECRSDPHPERPDLWEIWKLNGKGPEYVTMGANPAWHDGRLFYGEWNGTGFDYRVHGDG